MLLEEEKELNNTFNQMISYRIFKESDTESILKLWKDHSGWGEITKQQFEDWYINTPYGPCFTIVAESQNREILGQFVFMPREALVDGKKKIIYKSLAPVVSKKARMGSLLNPNHPVTSMFRLATTTLKQKNIPFTYSFPSKGWATWMKAFSRFDMPPWTVTHFDCFSIEVSGYSYARDDIKIIEHKSSIEIAELINSQSNEAAAVKFYNSSNWIFWRFGNDHKFFIYRNDQIIGYIIIQANSGLVLDLYSIKKSDTVQIIKLLLVYLEKNKSTYLLSKIKGSLLPGWNMILKHFKHQKEDYAFTFGMYKLDDRIDDQLLTPSQLSPFPGN